MKFSAAIVAAIAATSSVTDVSAFGVHNNFAVRRSTFGATTTAVRMSLDDLESKLLTDEPPKKSKPARKQPKAKAAPAPEPTPEPVVESKPAKKGRKKSSDKYDLSGVDDVATPKPAPKAKAPPAPKPAPKPKPAPVKKVAPPKKVAAKKVVAPPPKPVAVKSVAEKDPNAGLGVVVGAAPLLLAPVVALSAARGALGKTAARREAIQEEIAAKEKAAKEKAAAEAQVDAGGVTVALVSILFLCKETFVLFLWIYIISYEEKSTLCMLHDFRLARAHYHIMLLVLNKLFANVLFFSPHPLSVSLSLFSRF